MEIMAYNGLFIQIKAGILEFRDLNTLLQTLLIYKVDYGSS